MASKECYIAPLQGHTDAAWRHFHHKIYGGDHKYFTPFMRCEHGEPRPKDIRDFTNPLNDGINLEPQVIFGTMEELDILLRALSDNGASVVNLNLGCPFPLQTAKGRGAAFIRNISEAEKLPALLSSYPGIRFSVKMRIGMESPEEWKVLLPVLNSLELDNIYVHPRVARQQYKGELFTDQFASILEESRNPVVFNGDIRTPEDIGRIVETFPTVKGIMTARGIVGRPSLAAEYEEGEWPKEKRMEKLMKFHSELFSHYQQHLCGDAQVLSKIKPFWEYMEDEIGRKAWKAIRKATTIAKYNAAISQVKMILN